MSSGGDAYTGGFFLTIAIGSVETLKSFPIVLYIRLLFCYRFVFFSRFRLRKRNFAFNGWIDDEIRPIQDTHSIFVACQRVNSARLASSCCRSAETIESALFALFFFSWENKRVREKLKSLIWENQRMSQTLLWRMFYLPFNFLFSLLRRLAT